MWCSIRNVGETSGKELALIFGPANTLCIEGDCVEKMIGFCGITCTECRAFVATKEDDDAKRKDVAETWSKEYGGEIKPEDINCDGCVIKGGRHVNHWDVCEIRKCGAERSVLNCAHCDDYKCETLKGLLDQLPEAEKTLRGIRHQIRE